MSEIVTIKLQRPLATNGSRSDVLSYIVDEDDEQISNPSITPTKKCDIKKLFGDYYKVYYLAEYRDGQPVLIKEPTREDEWV
jgi:hypothetical protein